MYATSWMTTIQARPSQVVKFDNLEKTYTLPHGNPSHLMTYRYINIS